MSDQKQLKKKVVKEDNTEEIPDHTTGPLPKVDVSVLKKKVNLEVVEARRKEANKKRQRKFKKPDRSVWVKRPEAFVKEYRNIDSQIYKMKRMDNNPKLTSSTDDMIGKLVFIIRIKPGAGGMSPAVSKILRAFRLSQLHSGVFMVVTKKVKKMLDIVETFVTYGYPNQKSITELIRKRAHITVDNKRVPLNNNLVIEEHFGDDDILCIEDLVYEVSNLGPKFVSITKFLKPFKLTIPKGGFRNKNRKFIEGGDHGNRGDNINELIEIMN
eukprot:TRINITY_DN39_c1_g1_i1.p1 TRINITY_DN39_c1_g1~~TRINITY_DN39_c1_g1_i1.p1  ORF type:complete len:286 (+),score=73.13 TRINITY_DN39_c1_g1_i1:51-860(+)